MDTNDSDPIVVNAVNDESETNHTESDSDTRPLTIALERLDQTKNGYWRPGAFLKLTSRLRTSGLLQALPSEELKNLLFLLTFLSPNGDCQATVLQLADAMQVSQAKVRSRMQRLEKFVWRERPVVTYLPRASGLDSYALAPHLVSVQPAAVPALEAVTPSIHAAPREQVIAYSRARYARPRAEVERMIAEQNGWELPEETADEEAADDESAQVRRRLRSLGVSRQQVDFLVANFSVDRIQNQLDWLPYRNARRPAHFIVAAIEGDYEEPFDSRMSKLTANMGEATGNVATPVDDASDAASSVVT